MAYAVPDDVRREFPGVNLPVDSDNVVDESDLEAWLDEAAAQINGLLSARYVVPVVEDGQALLQLKTISVAMVGWRLAKATDMKNELPMPAQSGVGALVPQAPNVSSAYAGAMQRLKDLAEGKEQLSGAVQKVGIKSPTVDSCDRPQFKVDKPAW